MRRWQSTLTVAVAVWAAALAGAGRVAAGDGPATAAALPPGSDPAAAGDDAPPPVPFVAAPLRADSPVRKWFGQLADPDPAVRAAAEYELMGMDPHDLDGLRLLVRDRRATLTPGQVAALHEVVMQVYLSGLSYVPIGAPADPDHDPPELFLGIRSQPGVGVEESHLGISVGMRYPGFPSYRFLRDGDVILNAVFDPRKDPNVVPNIATTSFDKLISAIRYSATTHRPVTLILLRDGQEISRPVVLAPRPFEARETEGLDRSNAFMTERANQAETVWQEQFEPLVNPDPGAAITAE